MKTKNKDCLACKLRYCPAECYDKHRGSKIAAQKLIDEIKDMQDEQSYL